MCRNRGFWRMPVRGQVKCRIVATLYAITHNLMHQVTVRGDGRGEGMSEKEGESGR